MRAFVIYGFDILECLGVLVNDGENFRVSKCPTSSTNNLAGSTVQHNYFFVTLDCAYVRLEQLMISAAKISEEYIKSCPKEDIAVHEVYARDMRACLPGVREFDPRYVTRL